MIDALSEKGELDKAKLMDNYVTFLAGILRSVRFGASRRAWQGQHAALQLLRRAPAHSAAMPTAATASTSTRCAPR